MKFEYDEYKDRGECVAYIDEVGDLFLIDDDGNTVSLVEGGCILKNFRWNPECATKKFYKGDKVTITF